MSATLIPSAPSATVKTPVSTIDLGPFSLDLAYRAEEFLGLGEVRFDGTPLRAATLPWTFYTESEHGFKFERFKLTGVTQFDDSSATIHFESTGDWMPRIQEADAMGDARVKARRVKAPVARFHWTFRRVTEKIWENEYEGLAMQIAVESPGHPIHWIIEDTTWEIGGAAEGAVLIQQDTSTIDLEQFTKKDSEYSTIEKFFTDGWGGAFPMDMLPRAAGSAICDFQTKGNLAICLFAESPSLTRSRLEKFADENVIHYTDRPFFKLTETAVAPERKLLVYRHAAPLKRHEWRNLWLDCFTEVRRRILEPYGFHPEIPLPKVGAHLWDADLKKLNEKWSVELREALPEYHRLGYRDVFTHQVWNSITSDPNPPEKGNICCPYDFKFAESFGGEAAIKQLTEVAEANDITIFQWFSFHLSKHAPVWKEHPDWVMREANGDPWDGNYGSLWSGRFNSAYGDWMRSQIKDTCAAAGLKGMFWDSYQNLGVTCVDWASPDKGPQAHEIWKFQGELQQMGIRSQPEITTIFGVSCVAVYGFKDDKFRRRLWADTLKNDDIFVLLDTCPGFFSHSYPLTREKLSPEIYFWMGAHRVLPGVGAWPWKSIRATDKEHERPIIPGGDLAEEYAAVNHLYNEALPHMHRLRLVENGTHVLWLDEKNQPAVVWAFQDAEYAHQGPARELRGKKSVNGKLSLKAGEVWLLGDR